MFCQSDWAIVFMTSNLQLSPVPACTIMGRYIACTNSRRSINTALLEHLTIPASILRSDMAYHAKAIHCQPPYEYTFSTKTIHNFRDDEMNMMAPQLPSIRIRWLFTKREVWLRDSFKVPWHFGWGTLNSNVTISILMFLAIPWFRIYACSAQFFYVFDTIWHLTKSSR